MTFRVNIRRKGSLTRGFGFWGELGDLARRDSSSKLERPWALWGGEIVESAL